jgi:hypothetical protein
MRKHKKFIDPRYFMNEKTEIIKEELGTPSRFTGGSIDIEPLSDEEQTAGSEAYYELFEFLADSNLPGNKPSEKLQYALRWIAKFEQSGVEQAAHQDRLDTDPQYRFSQGLKEDVK